MFNNKLKISMVNEFLDINILNQLNTIIIYLIRILNFLL